MLVCLKIMIGSTRQFGGNGNNKFDLILFKPLQKNNDIISERRMYETSAAQSNVKAQEELGIDVLQLDLEADADDAHFYKAKNNIDSS